MGTDNNKKDHIALPASTLKRFREAGQDDFYYLDLETAQIYHKGPTMYQKQKGYYQKEFDDVCHRIETLMGDIFKHFESLYSNGGGYSYDSEALKSMAIDMIALQTARRPELVERVTAPDDVLQKIDERVIYHALTGRLTYQAAEVALNLRKMFKSSKGRRDFFYNTSFDRMRAILIHEGQLVNYSAMIHAIPRNIPATYLLTPYHYFIYSGCYIITISPRYAIALIPTEAFTRLNYTEGMAILVADENNVIKLIPSAIEATTPCVKKHLIGERYMLNKVKEYLLKSKEETTP